MSIRYQGFPSRALRGVQRAACPSALVFGALAAVVLRNLSGCSAMSSPQEAGMELAVKIDTSKPIRFSKHDFGASCFDTWGCRVRYNGFLHVDDAEDEKSAPTSDFGPDYLDHLSAGYVGVANFPESAQVEWHSLDRTALRATIDIGEIFKDQLVIHEVPADQLPPYLFTPVIPGILLVVEDRTIRVYMKAHISTKDLQVPGNRYSSFRNDVVLAYSKTY